MSATLPPILASLTADIKEFAAKIDEAKASLGELGESTDDLELAQARADATAARFADTQKELAEANADLIATQRAVADGSLAGEEASNAQAAALARQADAERAVRDAAVENEAAQDKLRAATDETTLTGTAGFQKWAKAGKLVTEAFAGIGLAVAGESVKMASEFQESQAKIQAAARITSAQANAIGNAFLSTAGKTEQSANSMAEAYAPVAAQLGSVQGRALNAKQALDVMKASADLADAGMGSLSDTTSDLASVMQAFRIGASGAAKTSDLLYSTANITGTSVDSLSSSLDRVKTKLGAMAPPISQMSGLLADMAEHGQTGRAAMSTLSTAFTTLLKPAADAAKAQDDLKVATDNLPPSLRSLAAQYKSGALSGLALQNANYAMSASQAVLWNQFTSAADAAKTANEAQQELGITVTNSRGQFVGLSSVIDQLHDKVKGMSDAQATAELSALGFGSSASKLLAIVKAGPSAFDKATTSVSKHNAAEHAAALQAKTLEGMLKTLEAMVEDYGVKLGRVLIPKIETLAHDTAKVVEWFAKHKAAAIGLAAVITGVLGVAVTAFVATKLSSMIKSLQSAYQWIQKLLGSKGNLNVGGGANLQNDASEAGDTLKDAIAEAGQTLITDANTAAAALKEGGTLAGAGEAEGGEKAAADMSEGGEKASADLAAGGEESSAELSEGGEKASEDISASGEKASADLAASGEKASEDLSAGGEKASADLAAGGEDASADLSAGGEKAAGDLEEGGEESSADLSAGGVKAAGELEEGGTEAAGEIALGGTEASAGFMKAIGGTLVKGGLGALIGTQLYNQLVGPTVNKKLGKSTGATVNDLADAAIVGGSFAGPAGALAGIAGVGAAKLFAGMDSNKGLTQEVQNNQKYGSAGALATLAQRVAKSSDIKPVAKSADVKGVTSAVKKAESAASSSGTKVASAVTKATTAEKATGSKVDGVKEKVGQISSAMKSGKPIQVRVEPQTINVMLDGKQVAKATTRAQLQGARATGQNIFGSAAGSNKKGSGISR